MPPSLLLSPSLDAASTHALQLVRKSKRNNPLAPVHLLLPTTDAVRHFRQAAAGQAGIGLGIHYVQFYSLASTILDKAGSPFWQLSETAIRALVRLILSDMQAAGEVSTFTRVADKPGFIEVLIHWLQEMKTQGIQPEEVAAHAKQSRTERDRQLAAIYSRYQHFLQENEYSDADGLLWLAAEALDHDPTLMRSAGPFAALGFDQFNPIQVRILQALTGRFAEFAIYLPWDPDRPAGSLPMARLADTRAALEDALSPTIEVLALEDSSPSGLLHVRRTMFEPDPKKVRAGSPSEIAAVAAASPEAEVQHALRAVKHLLLHGTPLEDIAILTPQVDVYQPVVRTAAAEYGLPIRLLERLSDNPAMVALINLLHLAPDFPWRETMDALRSPYIRQPWLSEDQIDLLDRLARERPVVAGPAQWLFALRPLTLEDTYAEDEDIGPPPLVAQLPAEALQEIEAGLVAFFDLVTPAASTSPLAYVRWLQEAILGLRAEELPGPDLPPAHLTTLSRDSSASQAPQAAGGDGVEPAPPSCNLLTCILENRDHTERDQRALRALLRAIRDLLESKKIGPGSKVQVLSWQIFRSELLSAIRARRLPTVPASKAFIRFGPLEMGRAMTTRHLFVLGLAEGAFPAAQAPDPLFTTAERENHPLPLRRLRQADDASLWWQVIANCESRLTMLRPRIDSGGAPWLPSPYWQAVMNTLNGIPLKELPIHAPIAIEEAASPAELLVALAQTGGVEVPGSLEEAWAGARAAHKMTRKRLSDLPAGIYEGQIRAPDLLDELASRYGPGTGWSVSRLNRYGTCPYGFFAQAALKLEPQPDPVEGLSPLQRGSLFHALMEQLGTRLAADRLDLIEPNQDAILRQLDSVCADWFPDAPVRYGFRPGPLWVHEQAEIRRQLGALVRWECSQNGAAARFHPFRQEVRFGLPDAQLHALVLPAGEGATIRLHGVIDRLDRDTEGNLRLIDYKSGAAALTKADIERGTALQTALYALAAAGLTGENARVAESAYLHIPSRKYGAKLELEADPMADPHVRAAVDNTVRFVASVRTGAFPSAPAVPKKGATACSDYCEIAALCRVTRVSIAKAHRSSRGAG